MPAYLLEIGCEEIPAAFIPTSTKFLHDEFAKRLNALNLSYTSIEFGGTPRRLFVNIEGLPEVQEEKVEIVMGPPANIAFDDKGELSVAGKKFAESKGIELSSLVRVTTQKGDYLQGEKKVGGNKTTDLLSTIVPEIIMSIPFPKSMKWGDNDFRFVRPIHWFLSIFNGETVHFETDNIKSGNITYGHRFLSPNAIIIKDYKMYLEELKKAYVIALTEDRLNAIKEQVQAIEEEHDIKIELDEGLLKIVSDLVEYPHAILGEFHESFLELPEEVLITSMKVHQKYFPVKDKSDKLVNKFVGVANIVSPNGDDTIRLGYERVLKARLNDGLFFYNNDKKVKLETRVEDLKSVVFQEKLGTSYEKMERFKSAAKFLSEKLEPDYISTVEKTAYLCKADLLSEMVYEFPELQGIMGEYYAKFEGIENDVATGIREHYLPRFAGDQLPTTVEGKLVSIADKIDTISGVFAAGMKPTGNLDPYGLRRSAIGILNIIEDSNYRLDLKEVIGICLDGLTSKLSFNKDEIIEEIMAFINLRWKQILVNREVSAPDVFDAVVNNSGDPIKVLNLAKVISLARGSEEFQVIASAFKRINNILKKNEWNSISFKEELFENDSEKNLGVLINNQNIKQLIEEEKNYAALDELIKFAPVVNDFFDNVMVMAEDKNVRENRLSLITALRNVFLVIGDLSTIAAK